MDLRDQIDALVADFQDRDLPALTPRQLKLPSLPGKVDAVVGMRRSGKTYFLYQQLRERLEAGIGRDRLLYLNFEDERLLPLSAAELHLVPEALYRRFPDSRDQLCWFFFDEIQNVPEWERFIRRLVDSEKVAIVVTGSSAKLLGREIATSLRGRSLASELLPFSFEEALRHADVEVPETWPASSRQRSLLENRFEIYMEIGGFPEVQDVSTELRQRILQDYVDVVLFRDVVERHRVENLPALRYLVRSLLSRPARKFSIHRLHNDLKSQGIPAGKDSLHRYLDHLEDALLLFTATIASASARARQVNPRKCYLIDPALAAATSFRASRDTGHLLENVVYLELRRRGCSAWYVNTSSGYEVDFLAQDRMGGQALIQVSADLSNPKTRRREMRALEEAMDERGIDRATLVTLREEGSVDLGGRSVRLVPAWRWLLDSQDSSRSGA